MPSDKSEISFSYSPYRHTDMVMAIGTSGIYGFIAGSGLYFVFQYAYTKRGI